MTRSLLALAAVATLASCSRDLGLPDEAPPRVDGLAVVGLEARTVASGLPVMAGEHVALLGSGFPDTSEAAQVTVSGEPAEVVSIRRERIVIRVPLLGAPSLADLTVATATGLHTVSSAFRYDGPGQPVGTALADLQTAIALGGVVPVEPGSATGFSDLAVAFGSGDSALLVYPAAAIAAASIPLGLIPQSAAARAVLETPAQPLTSNVLVQVVALDARGNVGFGQVTLSPAGLVVDRAEQRPLSSPIAPQQCHGPKVLFTRSGTPVGAWVRRADEVPVIATIDLGASGTEYKPKDGIVRATAAEVTGWAAWKGDLVVYAAGDDVYLYDAASQAAPVPLQVLGQSVKARLLAGCGFSTVDALRSVAVATSLGAEALAVSYRAGGLERVALVNLLTGETRRGIAGRAASSLALAPVTPYVASPAFRVLAATGGDLVRFTPGPAVAGCGEDLVPDASLALDEDDFAAAPSFAGMATFSGGTRVLAATPGGDVVTVLPPTLSSPGAIFRFASYGRLSTTLAPVSILGLTFTVPLVVAEHTWVEGASALDTGSAQLVLALEVGDRPLALGGSAYGRGSAWVRNPAAGDTWDGALAHTGDLPRNPDAIASPAKLAGGSSAVTSFKMDTVCSIEPQMDIVGSAPLAGNPDLVVQGPARAGQLGLDGFARHGPTTAPTYLVTAAALETVPASDADTCLSPIGDLDALECNGAVLDLGVTPLDVTPSAGDATFAVRSLGSDCQPCRAPFACTGSGFAPECAPGDILCQRAYCPVAPTLRLVAASGAARDVTLPSAPTGVAADRAGGFLVTLPCTLGGVGFDPPFDAICPKTPTELASFGALVFVPEGSGTPTFLAAGQGLAGALAETPNGAEVWVSGPVKSGLQQLTRLALPRDPETGALNLRRRAAFAGARALGRAGVAPGGFAASGIAFSPEGATAIATVPADYRILVLE